MEIILSETEQRINYQNFETPNPKAVLILAHGAGAGMNHPFMQEMAQLLQKREISVILFNFPYMEDGKKAPGSAKKNIEVWRAVATAVLQKYPHEKVFLGGKSYGGRMASLLLAEQPPSAIRGIVYLGFPLHAPGKDSSDRAAHLAEIDVPQLFLQGTKDKLAKEDLIKQVVEQLPEGSLKLFLNADHSFHVPKKTGKTDAAIQSEIADACHDWIVQQEK